MTRLVTTANPQAARTRRAGASSCERRRGRDALAAEGSTRLVRAATVQPGRRWSTTSGREQLSYKLDDGYSRHREAHGRAGGGVLTRKHSAPSNQ